jgi:hypothetical protein
MKADPAGLLRVGLLRAVLQLACFDRRGFAGITASVDALLASLAPLIAFPLVGAAMSLLAGHPAAAVAEFLATLCALLVQLVVSELLAGWWRREAEWLRYATAYNWCQWLLPLAAAALLLLGHGALLLGLPRYATGVAAFAVFGLYALALQGFLAWRGLRLGLLRAAGMVLAVNIAVTVLVLIPAVLAQLLLVPGGLR